MKTQCCEKCGHANGIGIWLCYNSSCPCHLKESKYKVDVAVIEEEFKRNHPTQESKEYILSTQCPPNKLPKESKEEHKCKEKYVWDCPICCEKVNTPTQEPMEWDEQIKYQLARGGCNVLFEPIKEIVLNQIKQAEERERERILDLTYYKNDEGVKEIEDGEYYIRVDDIITLINQNNE